MSETNYARIDASRLNWKSYFFQLWSTYLVVLPLISIFYRISFEGRENIPKDRKLICAANHISFLDPHMVFCAVRRPMTFMAKQELFKGKFMIWALQKLCAFAVNREKLEIATIRSVKDIMKAKGWNLCIFPQGGIFRDRKLQKINRGFVVIAKMSKIDILPISIVGSEKYNWIPFKGRIRVKIGKPISYELDDQQIIDEWGRQVSEMSGYEYISEPIVQEEKEAVKN